MASGALIIWASLPMPCLDEKKCKLPFMLVTHYTTFQVVRLLYRSHVWSSICARNMSTCIWGSCVCQKYVNNSRSMSTERVTKHLSVSIQYWTVLQLWQIYFDNEIVHVDCSPDKTFVCQFSFTLYVCHLSTWCVVLLVVWLRRYVCCTLSFWCVICLCCFSSSLAVSLYVI